jgi:hypothetical protein
MRPLHDGPQASPAAEIVCPLSLRLGVVAGMLNFELPDHPVYDAVELLWFDDDARGTGMLAFLRRREGRRTDYYPEPGLRVDPSDFFLGSGTGAWTTTEFAERRLLVSEDGVVADAVFVDVDGRTIEIHIDDRDGKRRRRCGLLGPVGEDIEHPAALLLAWLPAMDLVRRGRFDPVLRIGGEDVAVVRVPGGWLHRRHIIKYTEPLCIAEVCWRPDGPVGPCPPEAIAEATPDGWRVTRLAAQRDGHHTRLDLGPGLPDLRALGDGRQEGGRWWVTVDDARITGGAWHACRVGDIVRMGFDVDERWRPGWLPGLMRVVVRFVPMFRRWPTTYRWRAEVRLGDQHTLTAAWERVDPSGDRRSPARDHDDGCDLTPVISQKRVPL